MWQWIRYPKGVLADGRNVTMKLVEEIIIEELQQIKDQIGETSYVKGNYEQAANLFDELIKQDTFTEFLTLPAYKQLLKGGNN